MSEGTRVALAAVEIETADVLADVAMRVEELLVDEVEKLLPGKLSEEEQDGLRRAALAELGCSAQELARQLVLVLRAARASHPEEPRMFQALPLAEQIAALLPVPE